MKIDIRNFILDNQDEIKKMILSKAQAILIKAVRQRCMYHGIKTSAPDVAIETGISIQNASTKLRKLYDMGWLLRDRKNDLTGGCYYAYYTDF